MSGNSSSSANRKGFIALGLLALLLFVGVWLSRDLTSPLAETRERLEAAKAAVLDYAEEQGEMPTDLQAVVDAGFLDAMPENRSGFPLVYRRLGARSAELKSLGPDGKEGGFMFKRDHVLQFEMAEEE